MSDDRSDAKSDSGLTLTRRDVLKMTGYTAAALALPVVISNTNRLQKTKPPEIDEQYDGIDVLVIGSGYAGIFASLEALKQDGVNTVTMVDKGTVGRSGMSPWASDCRPFREGIDDRQEWMDNVSSHTEYVNNRGWLEIFMNESQGIFDQILREWGAENAHPWERANIFAKKLEEAGVEVVERVMITSLLQHEDGRVGGAIGFTFDDSYEESKAVAFHSKAVIQCTGAGSYKSPGFPIWGLTFDGDAMAYKAGAYITGKEFNDTHGTFSTHPAASYDNWNWAQDVTGLVLMEGAPSPATPGGGGGLNLNSALQAFQYGVSRQGRGGPGGGGKGGAKGGNQKGGPAAGGPGPGVPAAQIAGDGPEGPEGERAGPGAGGPRAQRADGGAKGFKGGPDGAKGLKGGPGGKGGKGKGGKAGGKGEKGGPGLELAGAPEPLGMEAQEIAAPAPAGQGLGAQAGAKGGGPGGKGGKGGKGEKGGPPRPPRDYDQGYRVGGATIGMGVHKGEGIFCSDYSCAADGVAGLYAAGDALGSMLTGSVYPGRGFSSFCSAIQGRIAAKSAAEYIQTVSNQRISDGTVAKQAEEMFAPRLREQGYSPSWVIQVLQTTMTPYFILYIKDPRRLEGALANIEHLRQHCVPRLIAENGHDLRLAHEAANMLLNAEMKLRAGLFRTESRGTHFREDYPARNDKEWLAWVKIKDVDGEMVCHKHPMPEEFHPDPRVPYRQRYPRVFPGEDEYIRRHGIV